MTATAFAVRGLPVPEQPEDPTGFTAPLVPESCLPNLVRRSSTALQDFAMQASDRSRRSPLKEKPLRRPGESLQQEIEESLERFYPQVASAVVVVALAALEWWRWFVPTRPSPVAISVLALGWIAFTAYRGRAVIQRVRNLGLGLQGEQVVGQQLEELRSRGCRIFHDVPGPGFNLDHVVVSPRGIYVVETKTLRKPHPGNPTVTFDGERLLVAGREPLGDYLGQVAAQRRWLRSLLHETTGQHFAVRSVLVFPGWFVENTRKVRQLDLWVLNPKALPSFLDREPVTLAAAEVALVSSRLADCVRG